MTNDFEELGKILTTKWVELMISMQKKNNETIKEIKINIYLIFSKRTFVPYKKRINKI